MFSSMFLFKADPEYQELEEKDDLDSFIDNAHDGINSITDQEEDMNAANNRFCREESLGNELFDFVFMYSSVKLRIVKWF